MSLWGALLFGSVIAVVAVFSGIVAYILISLSRAAPLIQSRLGGRIPVPAYIRVEQRGLRRAAGHRGFVRPAQRSSWANMHS